MQVQALNDIGYKGYLTIECEVGASPEDGLASCSLWLAI